MCTVVQQSLLRLGLNVNAGQCQLLRVRKKALPLPFLFGPSESAKMLFSVISDAARDSYSLDRTMQNFRSKSPKSA